MTPTAAALAAAAQPLAALDAREAQLVVSRDPPHVILGATPRWLGSAGYAEQEITGRSASLVLQGEGSCLVTFGALWTSLQARARPCRHPSPAPRARGTHPGRANPCGLLAVAVARSVLKDLARAPAA